MPVELSIDKVVSTVSLNVPTARSDAKLDYFSSSIFFQTYLLSPSLTFDTGGIPNTSNFNSYLRYIDFFNLYLDIPVNLYEGFPNLLNRISLRVLPFTFSLTPIVKPVPSFKTLFVKNQIVSYSYGDGYSYDYLSSESDINYLNEVDDLILAWNSSNNKIFQHLPENSPPELPPGSGGEGTGLKEFWA